MLAIHPASQQLLEATFKKRPHAVLLTGAPGVGLSTIAKHYAATMGGYVLTVLPEKDDKVNLEKGVITVDSIRRLYHTTRTIEPKGRIIIIDYAERMAPAAQNAFLKLLEEPSEGTYFLLLTHQPALLLPTITSRAQEAALKPINPEQSQALLDALSVTDPTKRTQLLFIAEGLPAELTRLAEDEARFEARATLVKDARSLVMGSSYTRLALAKKYKDSREDALTLVSDAMKLLQKSIATSGDMASLRMVTRLEAIHKRLTEQGNVRLQLSATAVV
jgi:DNA polymerase-3 subunit delta'